MAMKCIRSTEIRKVFLAFSFILSGIVAMAQIDSYVGAYAGNNKDGYLQPVASVLTAAFNTGQVTHTRIDSQFRVYFHFIGTASFILSDKLKFFKGNTPDGFLPIQTTDAPSIIGPRESVTVQGVNGTAYTFPAGIGLKMLTLAVPQLALGFGGTELTGRFFAYDTKEELGKINLWGLGLRHDIGQYFLKNNLHLSVGGMYQQLKTGAYMDLGTFNGSVTFGQQQRRWHYFVQGGYQSGNLKGDYKHYNGESFDQVSFDLKSDNPVFFGAGLGLNLGVLQLQLQVSGYEPVVGSFALGLKF